MQKKKPQEQTPAAQGGTSTHVIDKTPVATTTEHANPTPPAPTKTEPMETEANPTPQGDSYSLAASELATGAALEGTITQLVEMGFPREDVTKALKAAFNNPDRAVEYLMSGIPEHLMASEAPQQPSNPSPQQQQQEPAQPFNMFAPGSGQQQTGQQGGNNPLSVLRNNPQFSALRAMVQRNPEVLQPMLQELGRNSPQLLSIINENQEEFLSMINEPLGPAEENLAEMMSQMIQSTDGEGGERMLEIELTEEESAAVDRLVALGFDKEDCIEAFLICDKNEEAAANYLLENSS